MSRQSYILFLGSGKHSLHLMAEGLARRHAPGSVALGSAAYESDELDPLAVAVMQEVGVDITGLKPLPASEIEVFTVDLVVTLGDYDPSHRPHLPGMPPQDHWAVRLTTGPGDGSGHGGGDALREYRRVRDELDQKAEAIFASNLLSALTIARGNLELVLDNLAHGVMAHTVHRRIFFFNQAAERITGFSRAEVLGKDCHEVFQPSRFCGGDCLFCEGPSPPGPAKSQTLQVSFHHRDGTERVLEMMIRPLSDATGVDVGALLSFRDNSELDALKQRVMHRHSLHGLVGNDPKMMALFDQIREVAAVNVPVLIEGESGTGKELIANAIHLESPRADQPFVAVSCGALPEGVLESELFGHVRGAFSGAIRDKKGRFELADGGTIFLDEVAELSQAMQVKLLRVLQERCFERVGGERTIHVDVRVISATNQRVRQLMERGEFRRDLYYRLCVVPITPPPLKERPMDISVLVDVFLEQHAKDSGKAPLVPTNEALDALVAHSWPGNVRELRNVIDYVQVKCQAGVFGVEHLPPALQQAEAGPKRARGKRGPPPKLDAKRVREALVQTGGNRSRAARLLGVGRTTLYRFLSAEEELEGL